MTRCQVCKTTEAIWAAQFIGENIPTFSTLGSHIRGFAVVKVCDTCKETKKSEIFEKFVNPRGRQ
jgi:hypothetical protein